MEPPEFCVGDIIEADLTEFNSGIWRGLYLGPGKDIPGLDNWRVKTIRIFCIRNDQYPDQEQTVMEWTVSAQWRIVCRVEETLDSGGDSDRIPL